MSFELVMPRAGLTMVEGTISTWTIPEGSAVKKGDVVMEFENEKNTIEFNSTHEGLLHILAQEGDTVAVGAPIAVLAEDAAEYAALCGGAAVQTAPVAASAPVAESVSVTGSAPVETAPTGTERVRATGLARKMARVHGVDLRAVRGTGPKGRILGQDVSDHLAAAQTAPVAAAPVVSAAPMCDDTVTELSLSGVRRAIAKNMYTSLQSMAQCTAAVELDATELLAYRQKLVERQDFLGCKVTVNDLLSMAVVKLLRRHPTANATFDGKTLSVHSAVNLSVAVAAETGLMVPVVKNAERMSLAELHGAMSDLAARAREQKLRDGEQSGGTFTISNVGMFPIDWSTPIINPPQVAILGFGRAVKKPAVVGDEVKVRSMMYAYLTFDHRVFDGLEVGRILEDLRALIEHPELITA